MFKLRTVLILAFIVFVFLLTGILSLIMTEHSTRKIQNEIGRSLAGTAYEMSDKLDHFMWSRSAEIDLLAKMETFQRQDDIEESQKLLDQLQKSLPSFSWVGYMDADGKVLAATNNILVGATIANRPVFKEGIKGKFIGDVHDAVLLSKLLPNPSGEPLQFVDISLPIQNTNGKIIGVLAAHLSWEWSKEVERTILAPQQEHNKELELFIVSKSNQTVLLGPKGMVGQPLNLDIVKEAQDGANSWKTLRWPDGKQYLTGHAYGDGYLNYEGLGWTVLVRQPASVAFSSVKEMQDLFILIGLAATLMFAFIGWLLAERISRPIRGITKAADLLRAGEAAPIPEYREFGEIYSLSRSLQSLVDSLVRSESALGNMKMLAHNDQLTGLPNRIAFESYLEDTLQQLEPGTESLAIMYLDLDGFKKVNDSLGHHVGDLLLQKVAQRLSEVALPGNIAVRLGGDEFLLVLRSPTSRIYEEANETAGQIVHLMNKPFIIEYNQVAIGCSVGVAIYPDNSSDIAQIIQMADKSLYCSKESGKNRVTFHEENIKLRPTT